MSPTISRSGTGLRRAVFWDRDGTLMREVDHCSNPADVEAVAGAGPALLALRNSGWLNVVITNQSGLGRGLFSYADYESVNAELFRQLGIAPDGVYFCPETPDNPSQRRKPGNQMIQEACKDLGISTDFSWVVGDKNSDIECGLSAGCRTILVLTGYGASQSPTSAHAVCPDAAAAAKMILQHGAGPQSRAPV